MLGKKLKNDILCTNKGYSMIPGIKKTSGINSFKEVKVIFPFLEDFHIIEALRRFDNKTDDAVDFLLSKEMDANSQSSDSKEENKRNKSSLFESIAFKSNLESKTTSNNSNLELSLNDKNDFMNELLANAVELREKNSDLDFIYKVNEMLSNNILEGNEEYWDKMLQKKREALKSDRKTCSLLYKNYITNEKDSISEVEKLRSKCDNIKKENTELHKYRENLLKILQKNESSNNS